MATVDLYETNIHPKLKWMEPIIDTWRDNIHNYINTHKKLYGCIDVPYSSNERANISLLAGAAWQQKDGLSLEEYTVEKQGSGKTSWGRADVWIAFGKKTLSIEAKQIWQTGGFRKKFEEAWNKALNDSNKLKDESDQCMALIFVTLKIKEKEIKNTSINEVIFDRIQYGKKSKNIDLFASYFPEKARYLKFEDTRGNEWIWPGIYMMGCLV